MTNRYDENKPLYGSRGIGIYLQLLRSKYRHVDIDGLLQYSQMEPYQVTDDGHLFSQKQVNLFQEKIVELTGNKNIAREAGRFASSPEALGTMKGSVIGLLGPQRYYELIGTIANKISKSSHYEARKLANNKVEITVTPFAGTIEQPFQCENRMGYWEAVSSIFSLSPPIIEHPECLFRGDAACRYIVSWKDSPAFILKRIRNISTVLLSIGCLVIYHSYPPAVFVLASLASVSAVLFLNWFARKLEVRDLRRTIEEMRDVSDKFIEQIDVNYKHSLLISEISQALAKESDAEGLFAEVVNILQNRLDYDRGMILLANSRRTELLFQAGYGYTESQIATLRNSSFHIDNPATAELFASTIRGNNPVLLNNISEAQQDLDPQSYAFLNQMGSSAIICCPIVYEKNAMGILAVDNVNLKRPLHQRDINLLMGIASQIASRMHNMTLEIHLRQNQKMDAVGILAGGVAHDFNNVLTTIIGYSELISSGLSPDDPIKEMVEDIYHAGEKAAGLTQQLLAFSRKQILETKVTNLNTIVNNMGKMLKRLIGEDLSLEMITTEPTGNIKADVGQLEQVLMNLVVNARDAMPCGGSLTIETGEILLDEQYIETHPDLTAGAYSKLKVTDTGAGMSPEVQQNIFEPFFTTKERGKGTGLGLSTVYGIVKQHNGHINVYSEPGKGATFTIYFPVVAAPVEKTGRNESKTMAQGTETILVVDDDASIRRLIFTALKPLGYTLLEASCSDEALEVCRASNNQIDLLLSDVIMPGMNGRELSEIVRNNCPGIRIVLMSGYTDNVVAVHGVLEPGIIFINKPLLPVSLANKIREVLDGAGQ